MTVTASMVAQVRRMVAEPDATTYSDDDIEDYIEKYPMIDELGNKPYTYTLISGAWVKEENTDWLDTYDLNAVAALVWSEKMAAVAHNFDFSADGGDFKNSQEYVHADSMCRFFLARSSIKTITQIIAIDEQDLPSWVGNLPEPDI